MKSLSSLVIDSDIYHTDFKGMKLREMAQHYYSANAFDQFGVKGYKVPAENKQLPKLGSQGTYVKYFDPLSKKPKDFIGEVMLKSKGQPDP